jgi:signal transduction histidine kinase
MFKLSLRSQFLVLSGLVQALVVALLIWNSLRLMDNAVRANAARVAHEYAVTLNLSLSPYATSGRLPDMRSYLSEMIADPRDSFVRYIAVVDGAGTPILQVGAVPGTLGTLFSRSRLDAPVGLQTMVTGDILNASAPLLLKDNRIGALHFGVSTSDLARARDEVLWQGGLISLAGFAVGLLLLYAFTVGIGRRLSGLTEQSQRLARGDFDVLLPEMGGDELEVFSRSLNSMATALRERITQLGNAKAALKELNVSLESRVQERSSELQRANHDLSLALDTLRRTQDDLISAEKMASLGSLVAGIAHELNTPIGNSLLAATTLSDRLAEFKQRMEDGTLKRSTMNEHLDDVALACTLISGSLNRAANLISSFKQVAVDQTNDKQRQFDLRHVIEDTMATFAPRLKRANCSIVVEVDGDISLDSYPGSLCQVINNLVNNALVHAFDGRTESAIGIRARCEREGHVFISFQDDGIGMPDDVLRHVFDPFFTTKMGRGGTGLGMNIVYNIVTGVLGGRIDIDTRVGHGTTVYIEIPVVAPQRDNARKETESINFNRDIQS